MLQRPNCRERVAKTCCTHSPLNKAAHVDSKTTTNERTTIRATNQTKTTKRFFSDKRCRNQPPLATETPPHLVVVPSLQILEIGLVLRALGPSDEIREDGVEDVEVLVELAKARHQL